MYTLFMSIFACSAFIRAFIQTFYYPKYIIEGGIVVPRSNQYENLLSSENEHLGCIDKM
ncbi:hypothetical protein C8R41DRAFT_841840 [Lentinula lateritia]|uniref:Uncharacterized protein n=1 Tax=Lentinula lateritia TaxID=40482 RepID=A0ABQ8VB18_9AGAR|nr:hypothetical protein C8R41DRAFT_841840 [Lentinula lateritia]